MYDSIEGNLEQDEKIRPQKSHVLSRMATNIANGAVSNVQLLQRKIIEKADNISFEYFQEGMHFRWCLKQSSKLCAELENIGINGSEARMQELFQTIQEQPVSFETLAKFFIILKSDREEETRAKRQGFIKKGATNVSNIVKNNLIKVPITELAC